MILVAACIFSGIVGLAVTLVRRVGEAELYTTHTKNNDSPSTAGMPTPPLFLNNQLELSLVANLGKADALCGN